MAQDKGYVDTRYLDSTRDLMQAHKTRSYGFLELGDGSAVLEVGCGPGTDTIPLADVVGPSGRVVGVDHDPEMIADATSRARAAGVEGRVVHLEADATRLPFGDGAFDASRTERVFQHLPDRPAVLREMLRVTRSGGRIVVVDTDWATASVDFPDASLERRLMAVKGERMQRNGYAGRELFRLFRDAGLRDVTIEGLPVLVYDVDLARYVMGLDRVEAEAVWCGVVTAEELERWRAGLRGAAASGSFFACGLMLLAAGTVA